MGRLDGLEITEPGFTVRGDYVATREGYMRIDIYSGDEALGPDGGWQLLQGETVSTDLSADEERALRRGLIGNLYGLHKLAGLDYELSLAGTRAGKYRTPTLAYAVNKLKEVSGTVSVM